MALGQPLFRGAFIERIGAIDAADWNRCAPDDDPLVSHAFLDLLERSGTVGAAAGVAPCHLVLRDGDDRVLGVAPAYVKQHSAGEFTNSRRWEEPYARAGGRCHPKLFVGVPFLPVAGRRLLIRPGAPAGTAGSMIRSLEAAVRHYGLSSAHAHFLAAGDRDGFDQAGWLAGAGFQCEWQNRGYRTFDDFLGELTSRRRINIRRERRQVRDRGIRLHTKAGPEITAADWDAFFHFYVETYRRKNSHPFFTRAFFEHLGSVLAENLILVMASEKGVWTGGVFCVRVGDRLHVRNWGVAEGRRFLHFEACQYHPIEIAIERGLRSVDGGAGGFHKLERGFLPVMTHTAAWFQDAGFQSAWGAALQQENVEIGRMAEHARTRTPFRAA